MGMWELRQNEWVTYVVMGRDRQVRAGMEKLLMEAGMFWSRNRDKDRDRDGNRDRDGDGDRNGDGDRDRDGDENRDKNRDRDGNRSWELRMLLAGKGMPQTGTGNHCGGGRPGMKGKGQASADRSKETA